MEDIKQWAIQVLDIEGNVKYEASFNGTETQAIELTQQFEQRLKKDQKF
ncbi:hypothetical protein [Enterococcus avium]|nr:hypothetical protein [Enterococcus avium]MDB1728600.1 hypothetical protein [Enterococcus avium]MDB1732703.1 hypothetical protein [Enterococcus avium]